MAAAELLDGVEKALAEKRRGVRAALERRFDAINTSGLKAKFDTEGCLTFPGILENFCRAVEPRIASVHRPRFLDWYKQGWKASDFFHNSPGQPTVDINPSLRFIHPILSPLLCGLLSAVIGSPVRMVQGNVCRYSEKTNRCLENHFDGCPFSAIVHVKSTDPKTSGLWIERGGMFEMVPTPGVGDLVLIKGDQFYHRSCKVEGDNERTVIVFFLEYSNPKDAKRAAEEVKVNTARSVAAKREKMEEGERASGDDVGRGRAKVELEGAPVRETTKSLQPTPPLPPESPSSATPAAAAAVAAAADPHRPPPPPTPALSLSGSRQQPPAPSSATEGWERKRGAGGLAPPPPMASSDAASPSTGSHGSDAGRRRRGKRRVGYVLEEADKIEESTEDDARRQRDLERAKRRRRRALALGKKGRGGAAAHGYEASTSAGTGS